MRIIIIYYYYLCDIHKGISLARSIILYIAKQVNAKSSIVYSLDKVHIPCQPSKHLYGLPLSSVIGRVMVLWHSYHTYLSCVLM